MGMFDTPTPQIDMSKPLHIRSKEQLLGSVDELADATAPWVKENLGYESPERKMKSIASNADLTDGNSVQEAFKSIQAINPELAIKWLNSIRPVIQQQLDSLKIKSEQLKFTKSKNKPLITQRWNLEGKGNFILSHISTNFAGLEGAEELALAIKAEPKRADFYVNAFLNKMEKGSDKTALKSEYKAKLKEANTNYMEFWGGKDLTEKTTEPGTGSKRTTKLKTTTPGADDDSYYKDDPTTTQISQGMSSIAATARMRDTLRGVNDQLTGFIPEFLMTDAELEAENVKDDIQDWIVDGEAELWFSKRLPQELGKFKADPVKYWKSKNPKGK